MRVPGATRPGFWKRVGILCLIALANPLSQSAFVVRSFTAAADSMEPAIYGKERVLADLVTFRFSGLRRGDVVVYRVPGERGKLYMHRVVGLPGEVIELGAQEVRVNGQPLKEPWAKRYYNRGEYGQKGRVVRIPPGSVYVLGDFSSRSNDSRFLGFISERNVVGRVFKRYYPFSRPPAIE